MDPHDVSSSGRVRRPRFGTLALMALVLSSACVTGSSSGPLRVEIASPVSEVFTQLPTGFAPVQVIECPQTVWSHLMSQARIKELATAELVEGIRTEQ